MRFGIGDRRSCQVSKNNSLGLQSGRSLENGWIHPRSAIFVLRFVLQFLSGVPRQNSVRARNQQFAQFPQSHDLL